MRDKLMMYVDLEDEFNFQEHWFKILLRGKFLIQDLPDESIILIVSKLNARSFVRLIQTCKWLYDLIREKRPKITIFDNILSASRYVLEKREEKNVNIVTTYQFILRSDLSQIIGNKERIDLHFLETWDSRNFMNHCSTTYIDEDIDYTSVKEQSRHIVGIAGSTTTFLNKFRAFIRSHTPATIKTEQHIDPFIAIVRQHIEVQLNNSYLNQMQENSNLSKYYFPPFELYFEMGIADKRHVLDNFLLPAHSNYKFIPNSQVIEFSIFIFPAKVGIHGDVLSTLFENSPRLTYSINALWIPTLQGLEDFSTKIQNFRKEPTNNINKSVKMFKNKLLGNKDHQLTIRDTTNDSKIIFPKEFVAFFPNPVSFENNLRNATRLPKLYRTMPQQFLHFDTYVEKLLERVKDRRIWLKVLQRGKFILDLLPATYLLEIIKKMPVKEFTRMHRSAKWIEELIEARRHTFIKDVTNGSEHLFFDDEEPYSLSVYGENVNPFDPERFRLTFIRSRTGFYFRQISFDYFNSAELLKQVLECFRGARILVDQVQIDCSPIVNELFEIFQIETLHVWNYEQGLMQVDSFPCSLKKIEAHFMYTSYESFCNFIDNINDFEGILELRLGFENIGDLTEEIKSILMMKKRNPSSRLITIKLEISERDSSYSFKELFPFSEENFLFHKTIKCFRKMDHKIRIFDYDIFVQRVTKQGVIIVLALSAKSINDSTWTINFSCDFATNMKRVYELIWETFTQRILEYSDSITIELEGNPVDIQEDEFVDGFVYSEIEKKFFAQPSEEVQIPNE